MSVKVTYKGETLTNFSSTTKILKTQGSWLEDDITLEDEGSSIAIVKEHQEANGGIGIDIISAGTTSIKVVDTLDSGGGTIRNITADLVVDLQTKTVSPSDTNITVTADSGYQGLSECIVTPPSAPFIIPSGTANVTENGTHDISQYEYVSVSVVPAGITLQAKTATPSTAVQTITADAGYEGLSSVEIDAIPSEFIIPTGTIAITSNGNIDVTNYAIASVSIQGGATINNQDKSVTPSETAQSVTFDSAQGYTGLGTVSVAAISADYVGSGVARKSSTDLTASDSVVSVPSGYYESDASKNIAAGSVASPTIAKSAMSGHKITLTPSVVVTSGYVAGETITGNTTTVSASEVVGGNKSIVSNGNDIDVTNYQTVSVNIEDIGSVSQDSSGYVVLANTGTRYDIGLSRTDTQIGNILNMFYALEHGIATTGEFTLSAALPSGESLVLSTGLTVLSGFFIAAETESTYTSGSTPENVLVSILFWDTDGNEKYAINRLNIKLNANEGQNLAGNRFLNRCSYRWDNGNLYCTPQYAGNNNYTPFHSGIKYRWVAW